MAKIFTIAHLPDDLAHTWLQHLRDFDTAHPDCHFESVIDAPARTVGDMVAMLRIDPQLDVTEVYKRKKS